LYGCENTWVAEKAVRNAMKTKGRPVRLLATESIEGSVLRISFYLVTRGARFGFRGLSRLGDETMEFVA
jgi:hypothetical protein